MAMWKKKEKYVDLSDKMRKQQERVENFKSNMKEEPISKPSTQESGGGFFSFFGGSGPASNATSSDKTSNENPEDRKKRLTKIISDMTTKMEDLENQIYHLKQRMEVLERKQKIGY